MQMEAAIEQLWRCSWKPRLSKIEGRVGGGQWEVHRVLRLYSWVSLVTTLVVWWGDFTFELSWRARWWRSIMWGGMLEAEAAFSGQLVMVTMNGRWTILGVCCTQCELSIMACRDELGWRNFVFHDNDRLVEKNETWQIKMATIWTTQADMRSQGYNSPGGILKTFCSCLYKPEW